MREILAESCQRVMPQSSTALPDHRFHPKCPSGEMVLPWERPSVLQNTVSRSQTEIEYRDLLLGQQMYGI